MWELIQSGNVMMIPLGVCSLVAVAVIFERVYSLRSSKVIVSEVVGAVETLDAAQDLSVARAILERNPGPFANIVATGLDHAEDDWVIIRDVLQESGRQEAVRLSRNLNILEIVAAIAPLLGLLGTVTGMIRVFSAVSAHGLGQPEYMSGGISEAMITTAAGLIIGIPVLVMHQWLQGKADSIIFDMERYGSIVLDSLRRRNRNRSS
ncbi:MotA/TolQ/ExbB proton channel family protein [bacterium]|jgi:biopolymer transport protein ExbB|nr:MotA/TolQ/ExbB proton channel family protein [bacterium]